jgi:hypothetical protein
VCYCWVSSTSRCGGCLTGRSRSGCGLGRDTRVKACVVDGGGDEVFVVDIVSRNVVRVVADGIVHSLGSGAWPREGAGRPLRRGRTSTRGGRGALPSNGRTFIGDCIFVAHDSTEGSTFTCIGF